MSKRAKIVIGSIGILLIVLCAAVFFIRNQIRKSFPVTSGSIAVAGLADVVEVARDEFGVPHINARNEHDELFTLGFVHAQDRLWQMDMQRRVGQGRLSELFGLAAVPFDKMFRIVGIRRNAEAIERQLSPETRDRLQWYADGVNAFIAAHHGKFPVEFDLLRYTPEPWLPIHSIIVARLLAWELNISWWADLTLGAIVERVGLQRGLEILPSYPAEVAPTVPPSAWKAYALAGSSLRATAREFLAFRGSEASLATGSNAWVVSPSRSTTGGAILANDTHMQLQVPSLWFEVQMRAPGLHVSGMSIPGVPGIVAGRNDSVAWGITNVMADDADFYVEEIDSLDSSKYRFEGQWLRMTSLQEEIHVRGDTVIPLTVRLTRHGPIVSDVGPVLKRATPAYVASMRWTGAEIDDQIGAFLKIDRAKNWHDFTSGLREFAIPGQNFVYADSRGNIGYWCAVRLPMRGRLNSLLPLPGWDRSAEWRGFVPFEQLPHLFNPPEGFIATANNKIVDNSYPYHITDLWEPPARILRLRETLGKKNEVFSIADFERLQNDKFSYHARETVPYILGAFRDSSVGSPEVQRVLEYFRNWNYEFGRDDIATTIYQSFFTHLLRNTYEDEMGEDLFHDFVFLVNIPIRVTTRLLQQDSSAWFDDVRTQALETRDDIIRKSLRDAMAELATRFGDDMRTWRWGELHTVTLQHPFGLRKPLDRIFNVGPYPIGGGSTALISGEYSFNEPYAVTIGPSFRQIFDLADPTEIRAVLPSGQSGQVYHRHYSDQTDLWLNGGYRITRSEDPTGNWDHLRLDPLR